MKMISLGGNLKCLASPVFFVVVVPGYPRARAEAAMSTSTAALPWSPPRCWRKYSGTSENDQGCGEASP